MKIKFETLYVFSLKIAMNLYSNKHLYFEKKIYIYEKTPIRARKGADFLPNKWLPLLFIIVIVITIAYYDLYPIIRISYEIYNKICAITSTFRKIFKISDSGSPICTLLLN